MPEIHEGIPPGSAHSSVGGGFWDLGSEPMFLLTHMHIWLPMHTHMCIIIYIYICTCAYLYVYIYIIGNLCEYIHVCAYMIYWRQWFWSSDNSLDF